MLGNPFPQVRPSGSARADMSSLHAARRKASAVERSGHPQRLDTLDVASSLMELMKLCGQSKELVQNYRKNRC